MLLEREDRILTRREAAELLRISERTLDRLAATECGLRRIRLSPRRIGFRASEISAYAQREAA